MKRSLLSLTLLVGCTTSTTPEALSARDASLTDRGTTAAAERAWYQTVSGLSYEAFRPVDGIDRLHHLDVMDYVTLAPLALEPGHVYVDGPAVDNRGSLGDYVGPDGIIIGAPLRPWIDVVTCDGDILEEAAHCRTADRTEVSLEDLGAAGQRVTYRSTMPGDTEPSVAGSFVVVPGHLD